MNLQEQLRWGGLWIILTSLLMNGMNIVVYLGHHNATIQAVYAIGFTGLILSCTIIHTAQARHAGLFGVLAYLISLFSLALSNVVTFLTLAELAGIREAHQASLGIWHPVMHTAVYGIFLGITLLGVSIAITGVLPRWGGILLALGVSLQLPAQYAMEIAGQLFFLFIIGGSILCGAGLIWIGWALWSEKGWNQEASRAVKFRPHLGRTCRHPDCTPAHRECLSELSRRIDFGRQSYQCVGFSISDPEHRYSSHHPGRPRRRLGVGRFFSYLSRRGALYHPCILYDGAAGRSDREQSRPHGFLGGSSRGALWVLYDFVRNISVWHQRHPRRRFSSLDGLAGRGGAGNLTAFAIYTAGLLIPDLLDDRRDPAGNWTGLDGMDLASTAKDRHPVQRP